MAIGAGNLNRRIEIHGRTLVDDGYQAVETFALKAKVWASVAYISDSERFRAGAAQRVASLRFVIRKREVNHNDKIHFDGLEYSIDGIKPVSDQPQFIEITAGLF